jgi:flagellar biosynthetic protein FliR
MTDILINDFVIVLFITLRISSAFVSSPFYGHFAIPGQVKVLLALVIAYMTFLSLPSRELNMEISLWMIIFLGTKEVVTGLIIGYSLNIVFYGISFAGSLMGIEMGLSMAEIFNPMAGASNNVIGDIMYYLALMIFLLIDGHHYLIRGLIYSFRVIPIGRLNFSEPFYSLLIKYSGSVFIIAVKMASPLMVTFFLVNIASGVITRIIPQMQVFFVTQPLMLGLGFFMIISIIPIYVFIVKNLLQEYENQLYQIIRAMGGG